MTRFGPRNHRAIAISVAAIGLLIAAAGAGLTSQGSKTPGSSALSEALATVSPRASFGPSPSPLVSPAPTPTPPPADALQLVDSCDPASVSTAIPVSTPSSGKDSPFTMQVPILMYHRIVPLAEAGAALPGLVVPPDKFAAQLDALSGAGWRTITMANLADDLQARVQPPPKTFVITIDDGWDDGYTYALPILQDHGFVATYFVIAGRIDKPGFLSSAHIRALVAAGDEIGDHTMDHAQLARTPAASLGYEIDAAAARIAQISGRWPESFAYPFGGVDEQAAAAVRRCGELRTAVIEGAPHAGATAASPNPRPTVGPGASAAPAAAMAAAASPTTTMPPVCETWADRWAIPRIRVTPNTVPSNLVGELSHYR
jgi:peptidoglycan/xylan/chitin deacetylase (PgdA/CDA1 family)